MNRIVLWLPCVVAVGVAGCAHDEELSSAAAEEAHPGSETAPNPASDVATAPARDRELLALLRARYHFPELRSTVSHGQASSVPGRTTVRVTLPRRADGVVSVTAVRAQEEGDFGLGYRLQDARPMAGTDLEETTLYRDAILVEGSTRADLLRVSDAAGVEDFLWYPAPPQSNEVRYSVSLGEGVAGLRLVDGVLEAVDVHGTPWLRMRAPLLFDSRGGRIPVDVEVTGCALDRDPRGPWGRRPVPPGATECGVTLEWDASRVVFPALLDPGWGTTVVSMTVARSFHTLSSLPGCRLLAAGGLPNESSDPLASAEIFDAATETWSPTGSMSPGGETVATGRYEHAAAVLGNGQVLVSGGFGTSAGADRLDSAESYDPITGQWTTVAASSCGRARHTLSTLLDGKVLAVGGAGFPSAQQFDPTSGEWTGLETPPTASREAHTATVLTDGRVLIVGGLATDQSAGVGVGEPLATSLLWDTSVSLWYEVSPPATLSDRARAFHTATRMPDGSVLITGGSGPAGPLASVRRFFLGPNQSFLQASWTELPSMSSARSGHSASLLGQSQVVAFGGGSSAVEGFLVASDAWVVLDSETPTGVADGSGHRTAVLSSDRTAIVSGPTESTAAWGVGVTGTCCRRAECSTGFCVDGTCCDGPCTLRCHGCTAALKGEGEDGQCGPTAAGTDPDGECELSVDYPEGCGADGTCDGEGQCRAYAAQGTVCQERSCPDGVATIGRCDGSGRCEVGQEVCFPYRCSLGRCGTECSSAQPCATGAYCTDGRCRVSAALGEPCQADEECAPGACNDGTCCEAASCAPLRCGPDGRCPARCASGADCMSGWRCSSQGQCVVDAPIDPDGSSCGCRLKAARPPLAWLAAMLVGPWLQARRRARQPRRGAARRGPRLGVRR